MPTKGQIEHALCMVLMWCTRAGEPCGGFRFRQEIINARQLLGHVTSKDDLKRAIALKARITARARSARRPA